jgi:hypothetical protein
MHRRPNPGSILANPGSEPRGLGYARPLQRLAAMFDQRGKAADTPPPPAKDGLLRPSSGGGYPIDPKATADDRTYNFSGRHEIPPYIGHKNFEDLLEFFGMRTSRQEASEALNIPLPCNGEKPTDYST